MTTPSTPNNSPVAAVQNQQLYGSEEPKSYLRSAVDRVKAAAPKVFAAGILGAGGFGVAVKFGLVANPAFPFVALGAFAIGTVWSCYTPAYPAAVVEVPIVNNEQNQISPAAKTPSPKNKKRAMVVTIAPPVVQPAPAPAVNVQISVPAEKPAAQQQSTTPPAQNRSASPEPQTARVVLVAPQPRPSTPPGSSVGLKLKSIPVPAPRSGSPTPAAKNSPKANAAPAPRAPSPEVVAQEQENFGGMIVRMEAAFEDTQRETDKKPAEQRVQVWGEFLNRLKLENRLSKQAVSQDATRTRQNNLAWELLQARAEERLYSAQVLLCRTNKGLTDEYRAVTLKQCKEKAEYWLDVTTWHGSSEQRTKLRSAMESLKLVAEQDYDNLPFFAKLLA